MVFPIKPRGLWDTGVFLLEAVWPMASHIAGVYRNFHLGVLLFGSVWLLAQHRWADLHDFLLSVNLLIVHNHGRLLVITPHDGLLHGLLLVPLGVQGMVPPVNLDAVLAGVAPPPLLQEHVFPPHGCVGL